MSSVVGCSDASHITLLVTRLQEYGAQAADLSALYFDHDEDCKGNQAMFPEGYSQVVTALAADIQQHILLQHQVTLIQHSHEGVSVEVMTPTGVRTFTAQYAIVTFPLGVLKKHSSSLFRPPLPASKAAAIQRLGVGLLNKVCHALINCGAPLLATPATSCVFHKHCISYQIWGTR